MECFFCESEIKETEETETVASSKGPEEVTVKYKCKKCIHVWLTPECVERFRLDDFVCTRLNLVSEAIQKLCESKGGRLDKPLSYPALDALLKEYLGLGRG